jgi:hypothetical protein
MKNFFNLLFKLILLTITIYGLYLTFNVEASPLEVIGYFTSMVNVFTAMVYIFLIIGFTLNRKESKSIRFYRQVLMVYLLLISLVYSFVLIPYILLNNIDYSIWSDKDAIIHYLVPLMVWLDYGFFATKGMIKKQDAFLNVLLVGGYVAYLLVFIQFGGRFTITGSESIFPYFFLNYDTLGWPLVLVLGGLILLSIYLISSLVRLLDHIVGVRLK